MVGIQEIQKRDAALVVMLNLPPSEKWFRMWEDWFVKEAGPEKADTVRKLFAYARKGASIEVDARASAKVELVEMLESLARQVREGSDG